MRDRQKQKGIALLLVSGMALIIFVGILALLFVLDTNRRSLESIKERTLAYYLCEVGASVAILDITNGCISTSGTTAPNCCSPATNKWTSRRFSYRIYYQYGPDRYVDYPIQYSIEKDGSIWVVTSQVGRDAGFHRIYRLTVKGTRGFPVFIWGFPGK